MNSMTGYAYKEAIVDGVQISVELRSVNSRFLDLSINIPPFLNPMESTIREILSAHIFRGKLDATIRIHDFEAKATITANPALAKEYYDAVKSVSFALGKENEDIPTSLIIAQEGVLSVTHEYDAQLYWKKTEGVFNEVLDSFLSDRKREGTNLKKDLLSKLEILENCAVFFKEWQPKMEQRFRENISTKFLELLGNHVDENRIMQETAAMLVKYTINEEIIRLQSHLAAMRHELTENPTPGKRLDFICQEANREINTIGSKNQFTEIGAMVVNAKDALENIREQAKNVE